MRILHVIESMDPARGGPPNVVARLAAAQARSGHQVLVLSTTTEEARQRLRADTARVPDHDAVDYQWIEPAPAVGAFVPRLTASFVKRIPEADFIHAHGVWEPLVRLACHAAHRRRTPYAIAPHGMLDPWSLKQKQLKKRVALALGYRAMLSKASFIHALNDDERALLRPLRIGSAVEVIPNGIELAELSPLPDPTIFHLSHPEFNARRYILFLGRLHHKKGLDLLIEAFGSVASQFADVALVVAGPDGGAQASLMEAVRLLGVQNRVHVVGPLFGAAKLAALSGAACFVLPSRQEGFSIAVLEAMACGLPVVVSHNCHFPEIAKHLAGHTVPLNVDEIARALIATLQHPELAREMGLNGRHLVSTRFTWDAVAQLTSDVYSRFCSRDG